MSLLYIERTKTPSLYKGRRVSLPYREEARLLLYIEGGASLLLYIEERVRLLYIDRSETPSLYKGESVSLLYREEADPFSIERRE